MNQKMNTETDSKTLDAKNDGEIDCIRKMRDVDNLNILDEFSITQESMD